MASTSVSSVDKTGSLGEVRVQDVLLEIERASVDAQAWFETDYGMGQVLFHHGKMVKARLAGARGQTALLRLLAIREGRYGIKVCSVAQEPALVKNVNHLIALHQTRQADWKRLCANAPPLSSILTLTSKGGEVRDASRGIQRVVLVLLDGRRTLMQVLEESSFDPVEALKIVTQGIADDLVQVAPQNTSLFPLASTNEAASPLSPMVVSTPTMRLGSGSLGADVLEQRKATLIGLGHDPRAGEQSDGGLAPARIIDIGSHTAPPTTDQSGTPQRFADGLNQQGDQTAENQPGYIGSYEILLQIGRGELGTVYLARSTTGNVGFSRLYAVKLLHTRLDADSQAGKDFVHEARIASILQHANVASVYDAGFHGEQAYLVMEYVEGCSFDQLTRNVSNRAPYFILPIVIDALAGLQAAHSLQDEMGVDLKLVHCDLSPESVLVGVDGTSRLTDFGRARRPNQLLGAMTKRKAGYVAPELIAGNAFDHRADIFAMGVVLWSALTGRPLFAAESVEAILAQVSASRIAPPSALGAQSYRALDEVVMRALARDPDERFSSAGEMLTVLGRIATGHGGLATCKEIASWVREAVGVELTQRRLAVLDASRRNTTIPPPSVGAPSAATPAEDAVYASVRTHGSQPSELRDDAAPFIPSEFSAGAAPSNPDLADPESPASASPMSSRSAAVVASIFYSKNDYVSKAELHPTEFEVTDTVSSQPHISRFRAQILPWLLVGLLAIAVSIVILVLMKTHQH